MVSPRLGYTPSKLVPNPALVKYRHHEGDGHQHGTSEPNTDAHDVGPDASRLVWQLSCEGQPREEVARRPGRETTEAGDLTTERC